jgi:hypothetical protein
MLEAYGKKNQQISPLDLAAATRTTRESSRKLFLFSLNFFLESFPLLSSLDMKM